MTKQTVLFGSGVVAEKQLHLVPSFIVDNNPSLHGTQFHGIEIKDPKTLDGQSEAFKVVVCTTSVSEVKRQLQSYGYVWGVNADVADQLAERMHIANLEDDKFDFLISSGLPSSADSFSGGGIYKICETDDYPDVQKIYEGNTHGLIKHDDGYVFTCHEAGIIALDSKFEISSTLSIDPAICPHGIRRYKDLWVVVSSRQDAIVGLDDTGAQVFIFPLSSKIASYGSPQHHCNDIYIVGNYAYVSMFSITGNYKRNCFDGGIVEVDLLTGKMTTLVSGLTMPHSVTCGDNGFRVLNSFKGTMLGNNFDVLATLPGFVRGYDADDTYYYLGESKNRNFSRLNAGRSPVSIDSRITIINHAFGFSRSVALPRNVSEIHALISLK